MPNKIIHADNLIALRDIPSDSIDLIYIDPPFNTGKVQSRSRIKVTQSDKGDRIGFQDKRYKTIKAGKHSFVDIYADYIGFLRPRMEEAYRILKPTGNFYCHLNYHEVHYVKVMLDDVFGRKHFLNEVIWSYDYGARTKKRWPAKHDNILVYVKDPKKYYFDYNAIDRIPYLAPGLVGPEKAARGKTPTSVWFMTIVPTNSKEKTGYVNQKPLKLLKRIVSVSCPPGGVVLDFFAGSGTAGEAAGDLGCSFILIDDKVSAIRIMQRRLAKYL